MYHHLPQKKKNANTYKKKLRNTGQVALKNHPQKIIKLYKNIMCTDISIKKK